MIEVTKQELEFILGEEIYEQKRSRRSVYAAKSVEEMKQGREEYHYMPEELEPLWHKKLRVLFVTDGTYRIHYYTPHFHGSVEGTEDVLVTPFTCDRTGSGDAVVAGILLAAFSAQLKFTPPRLTQIEIWRVCCKLCLLCHVNFLCTSNSFLLPVS